MHLCTCDIAVPNSTEANTTPLCCWLAMSHLNIIFLSATRHIEPRWNIWCKPPSQWKHENHSKLHTLKFKKIKTMLKKSKQCTSYLLCIYKFTLLQNWRYKLHTEKFIWKRQISSASALQDKNSEHVYSNAYSLEFFHFYMNLYITCLHLNFCNKVHIWIDYKYVLF
jgi:hypothetical protein